MDSLGRAGAGAGSLLVVATPLALSNPLLTKNLSAVSHQRIGESVATTFQRQLPKGPLRYSSLTQTTPRLQRPFGGLFGSCSGERRPLDQKLTNHDFGFTARQPNKQSMTNACLDGVGEPVVNRVESHDWLISARRLPLVFQN